MRYLSLIFIVFTFSCKETPDEEKTKIEVSSENIQEDAPAPVPQVSVIKPGEYVEYHPSGGIKIIGIYNDNLEREGLWISYYEDGTKWSEAYYSKGMREGHSLTFYPNGNIRYMGEYRDDKKTGTWTFYDENGKVTSEEKY
jgi:antitoxin component YwqK of YwqJK toxin-antitoxin module